MWKTYGKFHFKIMEKYMENVENLKKQPYGRQKTKKYVWKTFTVCLQYTLCKPLP